MNKTTKQIISLSAFLSLAFLIIACGTKEYQTASGKKPIVEPTAAVPKSSEQEWQELIAAAKKEGKVAVYQSGAMVAARSSLIESFKNQYGLKLEWVSMGGGAIQEKLFSERRAGLFLVDIYISGASTVVDTLKPMAAAVPIDSELYLPEVTDAKLWWGGKMQFTDKERMGLTFLVFASQPVLINTDLVRREEIKSYHDLLNPKWKGKIIMQDPTASGAGNRWAMATGSDLMGWDYLREFVKQEPFITRDTRLQVEWVARGKYLVGLAPSTGAVAPLQEAGAPLDTFSLDEILLSSDGGTISLLDKAPHKKAAKIFINWILTREIQTIISKTLTLPSRRVDVPIDHLDPDRLVKPDSKYFNPETEEWFKRIPEYTAKVKEIFAPIIK